MDRIIPAHNDITNAKARARQHIAYLAACYRAGQKTAEDLTPADRESVQVWLLEHPRSVLRHAS